MKRRTRIFANRWFAKFAAKEKISDATLADAVHRAESGLIDADLGSGLIKQRIARQDGGKSGGYRSILIFRSGERAIFVFPFAKSAKANLSAAELKVYRKAARIMLELGDGEIETEVEAGRLVEVKRR
ncbi:type II toxin-antitoxin system RelE/ParE family toxin [Erythrobacter sp.]|uniref:type II toxin-antitoxin system RelE/ParE family toxin n=1 Tax=Erythrobacter sp. TaxID=1042 RepID=UPI001B0E3DE5|nr:type II toxin-antitoxin system RelE/ParE family toxin [Erythrobacter sp.]MBO6526431.1 type II toxin-antitoxin system RelE/ParE family toxin [Erythrobacter sp.]MBO6530298.1 type II toxin-antitoxin system RelE/ParE family toxin [Erythrobacter sp.]